MKLIQIGRLELFRTTPKYLSEYKVGMKYTTLDGRYVIILFIWHFFRIVCIWKIR
jgi:hypothetical protein